LDSIDAGKIRSGKVCCTFEHPHAVILNGVKDLSKADLVTLFNQGDIRVAWPGRDPGSGTIEA